MKTCTKCGETKPLSEFHNNKGHKDGKRYWCKVCHKSSAADYYKQNKGSIQKYNREYRLKQNYNITSEEYDEMLESQGGRCAICNGINANGRRLAVDHNHKTLEIRGLLCDMCNQAIGLLRDDTELLLRAVGYLSK